jgi:hypothetical protein
MSMFANKLLTEQKRKWTTADHIRTVVNNVLRSMRAHHLSHSSSNTFRSKSKISENCIAFKDQNSVHNSQPIFPLLNPINTVYITPSYAFNTDSDIVLPSTASSFKWSLSNRLPHQVTQQPCTLKCPHRQWQFQIR